MLYNTIFRMMLKWNAILIIIYGKSAELNFMYLSHMVIWSELRTNLKSNFLLLKITLRSALAEVMGHLNCLFQRHSV